MFGGGGEGEIASAATPEIGANRASFNLTFGHAPARTSPCENHIYL
jgi:hypothetical protein